MKISALSIAIVVAVAACSSLATAAPTIHWKLDETSGSVAADSSGNAIDGAWQGTVGTAGWMPGAGVDGGSVAFSGADLDVFFTTEFSAITATPFTVSAWVKTTSTQNDGLVFLGNGAAGNEYYVVRMQGNVARVNARNPAEIQGAGFTPLNDGEWHHVVGVYAADEDRQLYVDGLLEATNETLVDPVTLTRFGIGALTRGSPADLYTGEMDDAALWGRAFTNVDAAALNGLGVLGAGNAANLDPLVEAYAAQGTVIISGSEWEYATGLAGGIAATGGSIVGLDAFIVLDELGNGMRMTFIAGNPIINSYSATPTTIFLGETATISWELDDTVTASIAPVVGSIDNSSGSVVVTPTETTTYTLTATNPNGRTEPQLTITVIPQPIIVGFSGSPTVGFAGDDITLSWEVQNFTALEIDNGVGTVTDSIGSITVTPAETTTYTLTATNDNPGEMATAMTSITVFPTPPARELLLHWPLDEGSGTSTADLAGDNPGVFLEDGGPITWTTGQMGGALTFPNASDVAVRAITAPALVENYPFSMGGWVKTADSANDTFAVLGTNQNGQYHSMLVRNGNAQAITRTGGFFEQTGPAVNDDGWHHIVAVFSHPASLSLYVDGVFTGERTTEAGAFVTPDRFAIGSLARTDTSVVDGFNGSIDDMSFWKGILSANEVAALAGGATGLGLNASDIAALLTGFESQTVAVAAGLNWSYREGLAGVAGATGGSIAGGNAFIVLDDPGNGMFSEPLQFSIISVVRSEAGQTITWESAPGSLYAIQFSTDLADWGDEVDDGTLATGEISTFLDTFADRLAEPRGYYRVLLLPPAE